MRSIPRRRGRRGPLALLPFVALALAACRSPQEAELDPAHRRLVVDGRVRTFVEHLPLGHDTTQPMPLVLVFHGHGGDAADAERMTGLSDAADQRGFVVAYLEAYPGAEHGWALGCPRCTVADTLGIDDVRFTDAVVADVRARHRIDATRIWATGFSEGGMLVYTLACRRAGTLAAAAAVGALMPRPTATACAPAAPIAVATFFGLDDPTQSWTGSAGERGMLGGEETASVWAALDACGAAPARDTLPGEIGAYYHVTRARWQGDCAGGAEVLLYAYSGLGHGWPRGATAATREIVALFERHAAAGTDGGGVALDVP